MSVALGAFAAHQLRDHLDPQMLEVFRTATQYLIYHALAIGGLAILLHWYADSGLLHAAGWTFVLGVGLFCGSLIALALGGPSWFGMITPVGGLAFLLGWLLVLIFALRRD